jgi:hypothetical protein
LRFTSGRLSTWYVFHTQPPLFPSEPRSYPGGHS